MEACWRQQGVELVACRAGGGVEGKQSPTPKIALKVDVCFADGESGHWGACPWRGDKQRNEWPSIGLGRQFGALKLQETERARDGPDNKSRDDGLC